MLPKIKGRERPGRPGGSVHTPSTKSKSPSRRRDWTFELQKACMQGDCDKVRHCVEVGSVDVNMKFKSKSGAHRSASPLVIAGINGDIELFKTLLQLGANPSVETLQKIEDICVSQAKSFSHIQILQVIHGQRCITPFHQEVAHRRVGKLKPRLAPLGSTRVQKIALPSGAAAGRMLRYFVLNHDYESAKRLLCTGMDVNFCGSDGVDAMAIAVYGSPNQPDMVMLLMSFGAKSKTITAAQQHTVNELVRAHRKAKKRRKKAKSQHSHHEGTTDSFVNQENPFFVDPDHLQPSAPQVDDEDGAPRSEGYKLQPSESQQLTRKKRQKKKVILVQGAYNTQSGRGHAPDLPSIHKSRVSSLESSDVDALATRIDDWRQAEASFKQKVIREDIEAMVARAKAELRRHGKVLPLPPKQKKKKKKKKKEKTTSTGHTEDVSHAHKLDLRTIVRERIIHDDLSEKERLWNAVLRPDSRNNFLDNSEKRKRKAKRKKEEQRLEEARAAVRAAQAAYKAELEAPDEDSSDDIIDDKSPTSTAVKSPGATNTKKKKKKKKKKKVTLRSQMKAIARLSHIPGHEPAPVPKPFVHRCLSVLSRALSLGTGIDCHARCDALVAGERKRER